MNNNNNPRKCYFAIALVLALLGLTILPGCKLSVEDAAGDKVVYES